MITELREKLDPLREQLINHSLYERIKSPAQLRIFMEHHVFAVWDFMSLLTSLRSQITKTTSPWLPVGNPEIRYLINEIVLAEESDLNAFGKRQSHFEMYLDAMHAAGAKTKNIEDLLIQVNHGTDIFLIIATSNLAHSIKKFLRNSFEVIYSGEQHKIAAAFTFGREGLIPEMFGPIIQNIQGNFPKKDLKLFQHYFDRHIELDADEHAPMAYRMLEELCGNDSKKWNEALQSAESSLKSRLELWDGIEAEI